MSHEVFGSGIFAPSSTLAHMFDNFCQTCGLGLSLVGVERFERSTSRTRTVRSTGLSHTPNGLHYTILVYFVMGNFSIRHVTPKLTRLGFTTNIGTLIWNCGRYGLPISAS